MQDLINLIDISEELSRAIQFYDMGCGLGKPTFHVAQYLVGECIVGIEVKPFCNMLGMCKLEWILRAPSQKQHESINHTCFLSLG